MSKIKILVDTSADIPDALAKKYDIDVINFLCIFDGEEYVAGEELSNAEFYKKLEESEKIPTTAQTPYGVMLDTLEKATREYDTVIFFTISSKASGQYHSATRAADEIKEQNPNADIHIFDSMSFSVFISSTAIYARKLLNDGIEVSEVLEKCREFIESWEVYILVDSLKYLEKGGRITKTAAIVGTLLDIRPVLTIRNGLIEPLDKIRGKKRIYNKLISLIEQNPAFDAKKSEFIVIDSCREYGESLTNELKESFEIDDLYMYSEFGPIVGTHIGPGALAVLFRIKK